ncbi:MAG TPA: hypothetical protein VK783_15405 [Bacteroidia bacterium]|jgi:hypothetical protein|nr:hypothetical protein [Bacteroidia bacterium]
MKKLLFLIFFFTSIHVAFSQNGSAKISVFTPSNSGPQVVTKADSASGHDHNCIKWNYSLLTRGVLLFNWEFWITGNLTGEAGLGLTYRDFVFEFTRYTISGNSTYGDDNSTPWNGTNAGLPVIHPCGEIGLKYYFSGFDNFEGFYGQGAISYRPYSFAQPVIDNTTTYQDGVITPGYSFFDIQFKLGYQYNSRYNDFTIDSYIGVGYRNATLNYYQSNSLNNGMTEMVPQTITQSFPQLLLGEKIGYSF